MATTVKITTAHTRPAQSQVAEHEVKEYIYDAINDLGEGQVPINPEVVLTLFAGEQTVVEDGALLDTPATEESRIYIRIANIEKGKAYLLTIQFDHSEPRVPDEHTVRFHVIDGV